MLNRPAYVLGVGVLAAGFLYLMVGRGWERAPPQTVATAVARDMASDLGVLPPSPAPPTLIEHPRRSPAATPLRQVEGRERFRGEGAPVATASSAPMPYLDAWSKESVDQDWTADLSSYLLDAFSELEIEAEVVEVSCRSTLCRVQVEFASLSDAERFSSDAHMAERQKQVRLESVGGRQVIDALLTR